MRNRFVYLPVVIGGLFLVLSLGFSVWRITQPQKLVTFSTQAGYAGKMVSFFPDKGTYGMGEMSIGILLESGEKAVDRVDLVVKFDPEAVEVTSLVKGILMDDYVTTRTNNNTGEMMISAANLPGRAVNGILASFRLRPKVAGETTLQFKQAAGVDKGVEGRYTFR